jgi:transcriptional regulator with XRE-family HTH domain
VVAVAISDEIRDFLTSRRARLGPEQVGLGAYGGRRRVPGLRREEVATLAGISIEYYTQLERGNARGASDEVLDAVADALQLNDAERTHLYHLVRAGTASQPAGRRPSQLRVRASVQRVLDAIGSPAIVRNGRLDILAANLLGDALYAPHAIGSSGPPNIARLIFLDARGSEFFTHWEHAADDCVALLRAEAGRHPYDRRLSELIGELSTRSDEFRTRWAGHDVKLHRTGIKQLHHSVVGDLTIDTEVFELPNDPGQTLVIYTAEPGSPSQERLDLLASWISTPAGINPSDEISERN